MNNTTFSFNKKQIVQSVLEPDTHSIWLNSNDNKLYKFGNSGWEPVGGTNIYRIYLTPTSKPDMLELDQKYDKENTLARRAFNEDEKKHTNNIYLITLNSADYDELTGVANCYGISMLITDFILEKSRDLKTGDYSLVRMIISTDAETFKDLSIPNTDVPITRDIVVVQATSLI